ncbi:hypothetical protein HQ531_00970 [bacterium]|nr:hypothetical protein [bacterium]
MKKTRNTLIAILILIMSASILSAKPYNVAKAATIPSKGMAINIIQHNQEHLSGQLIDADDAYFVFENDADASIQIIPRGNVQLLETNMDINIFSILKSKDPNSLTDMIELNDGTKIPSIILDVGAENIQYFSGKSMKRESVTANSIYMLYVDNASISIPFPISSMDTPAL